MKSSAYSFSGPLAAWITAGRRLGLAGRIGGFLDNATRYGHELPILIGNDGSDESIVSEVHSIRQSHPDVALYICGSDERRALITSLSQCVQPLVLASALLPRPDRSSCGPNRNAMLLCAAGQPLIMSDDDVDFRLARLAEPGSEEGTLNFAPPSREAAVAAVSPVELDLVGEHLSCLSEEETRICSVGFYGAAGSSVNRGILSLQGAARHELMNTGYVATRDSPYTVRIPATARISAETDLMAAHGSYNSASMLPPFFSSGRNDDGFFALMVRLCYPASRIAYPAFGVFHNPDSVHTYTDSTRIGFALSTSELFMSLSAWALRQSGGESPEERMIGIGSVLHEVASLHATDCIDLVVDLTSPSLSRYEAHLEGLLEEYNRQPDQWAQDVEALLGNLREKIREPALLFGSGGCGLGLMAFQEELAAYGALLEAWPQVWAHCVRHNAEGKPFLASGA